ncbi:hypothetical protein FNH05_13990 [Amycolatopsis rhizosphaerae]|uniref:Uncharacterized protein n=1 Tax=Amycolatopsis rhizosphaerae TaxID=2053003 RepID=A0A558CSV8_9PSEU|nr:hypothetical protein FNH05_13990 [Amycolatopsis rhizosphaerae]
MLRLCASLRRTVASPPRAGKGRPWRNWCRRSRLPPSRRPAACPRKPGAACPFPRRRSPPRSSCFGWRA